MKPKDIPNLISFARILLTIPVVYLLLEREFAGALIIFAVAGLSDGLDGFLAKHFHWQSRLGGLLDPLADKALLMASFLILGGIGLIPVWIVSLVIFRDLIIVGGALSYHFQIEDLEAEPRMVSKLNTVIQILTVILVIADAGPFPLPAGVVEILLGATVLSTTASGIDYVWIWSRRAAKKGRKP